MLGVELQPPPLSGGVEFEEDQVALGSENVIGSGNSDTITGNNAANVLSGRNGGDTISAGDGYRRESIQSSDDASCHRPMSAAGNKMARASSVIRRRRL